MLIVVLSTRISPRPPTVIFWLRVSLALAVDLGDRPYLASQVAAMESTESARSRQAPSTPGSPMGRMAAAIARPGTAEPES